MGDILWRFYKSIAMKSVTDAKPFAYFFSLGIASLISSEEWDTLSNFRF
jgi:hypothetical protein